MSDKIRIGGNVGGHVGSANTGNINHGGDGNRWLIIAIVAIVLIIALGWGVNHFVFEGWWFSGES